MVLLVGIVLFLSPLLPLSAQAHDTTATSALAKPAYYKHEIGLSYGYAPAAIFYVPLVQTFRYLNLNLDYNYNFNAKHTLCVTLNVFYYFDKKPTFLLTPLLGYRYNYYHKGIVSLYLSITIGNQFCVIDKATDGLLEPLSLHFAYQACPLDIRIGAKNHNAIIELGVGNQGVVKIGYQYRFNNKKNTVL